MTEEQHKAFDADKVAAALNAAADRYTPPVTKVADLLNDPKIIQAVKNLKARGFTAKMIAEVLNDNGIKLSAGTFNKYWSKMMSASGETSGRPRRNSKASKVATTPRTSEAAKTTPNNDHASEQQSEVVKPSEKPPAGVGSNPAFRDRKSL